MERIKLEACKDKRRPRSAWLWMWTQEGAREEGDDGGWRLMMAMMLTD